MVSPLGLAATTSRVYQTIYDIFSQLPPRQRRQKCLLAFLMPDRIDILQATESLVWHITLEYSSVSYFSSGKHYGKEYRKLKDNCTSLID